MKKVISLLIAACIVIGCYCWHSIRNVSQSFKETEPAAVTKKQLPLLHRTKASVKTLHIGKIYGKAYLPIITRRVPLVIIANGYTASYRDYEGIAKRLYRKGIACVVFDFRGGSKTSKSGRDMKMMTADTLTTDLRNVLDYMKKQDYVDLKNIYLAGHSQGGLIASLVANHRHDLKGLFLVAPAYNIPLLLRYDQSGKSLKIGNGVMSAAYIRSMKKVHLYQDISDFNQPVYIFHGSADTTVPLTYSKEAIRHYPKGHLIVYSGESHVFDDATIDQMCAKVESVIKKNA